jgi:hypothetical protein
MLGNRGNRKSKNENLKVRKQETISFTFYGFTVIAVAYCLLLACLLVTPSHSLTHSLDSLTLAHYFHHFSEHLPDSSPYSPSYALSPGPFLPVDTIVPPSRMLSYLFGGLGELVAPRTISNKEVKVSRVKE